MYARQNIDHLSKNNMDSLFLLQFACFIFMLINAFAIAVSHLHVRWENKRYEHSRWMIFAALIGLAIQYGVQMAFGFRAMDDDLGAVINVLIYTPCFSLISMAIYNIEATHAKRKNMNLVCGIIYAAIIIVFCIGVALHHSLRVGAWMYVMLALFYGSVAYCICMIVLEMKKRRNMLETMAATDMLPYVRYSRASVVILCLASLVMPFAILSTTLLFIVGPIVLLALLFFNITFVSLVSNYVPTEELLDKEEESKSSDKGRMMKYGGAWSRFGKRQDTVSAGTESLQQRIPEERVAFIQNSLDAWCADLGYKDSTVNMLTLSRTLRISKEELSAFFDQCMKTTFRIWLSEIRFKAAKKMMLEYPDYSNDIVSAECGFSSRTYLYRVFKAKEGCTPTEWRDKQTTNVVQNEKA